MIIRLSTLWTFLGEILETLNAEAKMLGRMADFGKLQGFFMLFQVIGGFLGTLITGAVMTSWHIGCVLLDWVQTVCALRGCKRKSEIGVLMTFASFVFHFCYFWHPNLGININIIYGYHTTCEWGINRCKWPPLRLTDRQTAGTYWQLHLVVLRLHSYGIFGMLSLCCSGIG